MALTPKQAAQVAKAPPAKKAAMRATFQAPARAPAKKKPTNRATESTRRLQGTPAPKAGIPNFLDPMNAVPAPSVTSDGKALPHTGLVSGDFVVNSTHTTLLLVTNTGDSGTVGVVVNVDNAGVYVGGLQIFTIPTLAVSDTDGGASASRAMKFSVSVVNCSNALKRGGRVTYLNSSQRLPAIDFPISSLGRTYHAVTEAVKSSPQRRRVTGDILGSATHLIGFPVDSVAYATFLAHRGTLDADGFFEYVVGASSTLTPKHRPMSIVAYVFDPVADPQDYSVTIRASMYTRWPLTSIPGQSMRNIPTADAKIINHVRNSAESRANDLAHVLGGGVLATVAPRAVGAARTAGGGLISRLGGMVTRGAATAAETVGLVSPDIIGAEGLAEAAAMMLL